MYPVSFDNPNGRTRPQRAAKDGGQSDPRITASPEEDRLLVVECRTDDRWRVVLCTGLEDLDDALDTVRSLRRAEGTDEVSLTIEVSGTQGRESRREVVRFGQEAATETQTIAPQGVPSAEMQAMEAAFAAVSPAFKIPDISFDDMISPKEMAETPFAVNDSAEIDHTVSTPVATDEVSLSTLAWEGDLIRTHDKKSDRDDDIPEFLKVDTEEGIEFDAQLMDEAPVEEEPEDELEDQPVDLPYAANSDPFAADRFEPRRRIPQSFASSNRQGWIDDLLNNGAQQPIHASFDDEDDDELATRLESPMFARENGVTAKVLVFAGTVALLILGGALAELLAVDITSSANAQSTFLSD